MARIVRRASTRGITMIEVLVATVIITVAMIGTVSVFFGVSNLTRQTTQSSTAANLARRAVEEAKNKGFPNLTDGTTVRYYDVYGAGGSTTRVTTDQYSVTTVVSTDIITSGVPDKTALRTVVATVRRLSDSTVLETSGTYLAWGGP